MTARENSPPAVAHSPETLIARARAMIPTLAGRASAAAKARRQPAETIAEMQAAGLFRVLQPKRWGGYEMDAHVLRHPDRIGRRRHVAGLDLRRGRPASVARGAAR